MLKFTNTIYIVELCFLSSKDVYYTLPCHNCDLCVFLILVYNIRDVGGDF